MVILLSDDKGDYHHGAVTDKGGPRGTHVAHHRNQEVVERQCDDCANDGDIGAESSLSR